MDKLDQLVLDLKKAEARDLLKRTWKGFGFCNCGNPEGTMRFIGRVLAEKRTIYAAEGMDESLWDGLRKLLPYEDPKSLIVEYLLASKGLTEHGGGVGGSWLSGDGKDLLDAIELVGDEEWDTDD
jgi:hypothetical protein